MLGCYRLAVEDNTDSFWKQEENEMLMKILIESSSNSIIRVILTSVQENNPVDVPPPSPLVASAIPPYFTPDIFLVLVLHLHRILYLPHALSQFLLGLPLSQVPAHPLLLLLPV